HAGSREPSESLKAAYVRRNPGEAGKPGLPMAGVEPAE
ncbi:sterol desaturase family protein, partial [Mesorhizobium sp. M7A.F.Ca.US.001.02.1.1]